MPIQTTHPKISLPQFEQLFESIKNWGKWGEHDQRGTLNYITPDKIRAAAALVRKPLTCFDKRALEALEESRRWRPFG